MKSKERADGYPSCLAEGDSICDLQQVANESSFAQLVGHGQELRVLWQYEREAVSSRTRCHENTQREMVWNLLAEYPLCASLVLLCREHLALFYVP